MTTNVRLEQRKALQDFRASHPCQSLDVGGTAAAACELVEKIGGKVAAVGALVELEFLNGKEKLNGRPFYSFLKY